MMTIIMIIMINGEREDSLVTCFTFKTSGENTNPDFSYAIKLILESI